VVSHRRAGFLHQLLLHARDPRLGHRFLRIDVHRAEACFGVPFLTASEVLADATGEGARRRPAPALSFVIDLLGPLLSGGVLPEGTAERLGRVDGREVLRWLTHIVGATCAQEVLRVVCADSNVLRTMCTDSSGLRAMCADSSDLRAARADSSGLRYSYADSSDPGGGSAAAPAALRGADQRARRALLVRAFLRRPVRSVLGFVAFGFGLRVAPYFRRRGLVLAVLGTDGSGKSTLVEALRTTLAPAYPAAEGGVLKLRPGLLPQLDRVVHGRATYGAEACRVPHRAAPSGRVGTLARALWYGLDYVLGWPLCVLPRQRRAALLVFDRYVDDWRIDPARFRMQASFAPVRWLASLAPRPNAVVVCTARLATVRARKQELAEAETARQLAAYEAYAAERRDVCIVSTDAPLEACVDTVLDHLFPSPEHAPLQLAPGVPPATTGPRRARGKGGAAA
jgi:thymidylate kinase